MQILELLLSFFLKDQKLKTFAPLIELFSKNSFNLEKTLKNINLEAVAPIIKAFLQNASFNGQKNTPAESSVGGASFGLNPIANLADKDIVYSLNKYFA